MVFNSTSNTQGCEIREITTFLHRNSQPNFLGHDIQTVTAPRRLDGKVSVWITKNW